MTIRMFYSQRQHGFMVMTLLGLLLTLSMPQGVIGLDTIAHTVPSSKSPVMGLNEPNGSTTLAGSSALGTGGATQLAADSTVLLSLNSAPLSSTIVSSLHSTLSGRGTPIAVAGSGAAVAGSGGGTTTIQTAYVTLLLKRRNLRALDTTGNDNIVKSTSKSTGLSQLAIIIIAVGAGIFGLVILMLICYYMSSQRGRRFRRHLGKKDSGDSPQLQLGSGGDGGSTLAMQPPTQNYVEQGGGQDSIAGYGDQSTTMNYDHHSNTNRGVGDTLVSDPNTHGDVEVTARAAAASTALGKKNSSEESDFFDAQSREPSANINRKEELIDIYAPPGKLGVVIDTPDGSAPVVHAIRNSSVIANKLHVGDKLVTVDDEDVRDMTATTVSELISKKSANPTRKLGVLRAD